MQPRHGFITGSSCCQSRQLLFILPATLLCTIAILSVKAQEQCDEGQYKCPPSTTSSNTTSPSKTTNPLGTTDTTTTPTTESGLCCMNCSKKCETCMGGSKDMCLSCNDSQVLVAEFCEDSLLRNCLLTDCFNECKNETNMCHCMLSSDSCTECLMDIAGQCKEKCDYDMKPKDFEFESENRTVCVKCDPSFLGFCVEIYLVWIIAAPIAIFVVLLVVIVTCICCYFRREGKDNEKRPSTTPVQDYPTTSRQHTSFSTGADRVDGYNAQEVEDHDDGDIYGNVDSQNNVMMQRAPSAEHEASIRPNVPLKFRQAAQDAFAEQLELGNEPHGNEETQRMEDKVGYIHMKKNVHVDRARFPPNMAEPEDQPLYGNQLQPQGILRHESVPIRLPPSIPQKKKTSGTFPVGMEMHNFSGRTNEGYEEEDNYPDLPPPSPPMDSMPSYPPPKPPSLERSALKPPNQNKTHTKPWERTDAGPAEGGSPASELQQMFNKRNQTTEPEIPEDMPSVPPPPVPGGLSSLQQNLKANLQKRESDKRPLGIPAAPFKGFPKAVESDSDEELEYEEMEDELSARRPMPLPNTRQPLPLPKNKKKKKGAPPAVPVKPPLPPETQEVYEVMDTGEDDTRPRMPFPVEDQELYEAVDPSDPPGEVYEVTEVGTSPPTTPTTAGFQVEDDDIYQNTPAVKHGVKSGRYRNLPADRGQQPVKEGGYAKWAVK